MDDRRFDAFARTLATSSRRQLIGRIFGVVAGGGIGWRKVDDADAASCRAVNSTCRTGANCCSGVCEGSTARAKKCRCQSAADCPTPKGVCKEAVCSTDGTCSTRVAVGAPCAGSKTCTGNYTCGADGRCRGESSLPTITCPANISAAAAAGTCGTVVHFAATGSCADTITCSPASDTTFSVGETTVTCTAKGAGGEQSCSFTVDIDDRQDPVLSCPESVKATSLEGGAVPVSFNVSATDNCGATVQCSRSSGSNFPVGTTTVTCTATDGESRTDSCQFPVTVCAPDCAGKSCGPDGCGGTCGSCPEPGPCETSVTCAESGQCVAVNAPPGFSCSNGNKCQQGMTCNASGTCQGGFTVVCPEDNADRCNAIACDPDQGCVKTPTNNGGQCRNDLCNPGKCDNGVCTDFEKTCPVCQTCQAGQCVASDEGNRCEGDVKTCHGGFCCNLPTSGSGGLPTESELKGCFNTDESDGGICCESAPCCPGAGACCDECFTIIGADGLFQRGLCCPPEQQCNGSCCYDGQTCLNGACVRDEQVCADGEFCNDACCGSTGAFTGVCCNDGFCDRDGSCLEKDVVCESHAECRDAGYDSCAGLVRDVNSQTGQLEVVEAGVCCGFGYTFPTSSMNPDGPIYACCSPGTRFNGSVRGCCPYPNYSSACNACVCSFVRIERCC